MTASVYLVWIYKPFVSFSTEEKRNRMFSLRQRTDERQSAVSLIHFTLILYSQLCTMKNNRFQRNSPRLPLPREHSNATTKAYAKPRDWSVEVGDDEVNHINHTPPRAGTRRGMAPESLCAPSA